MRRSIGDFELLVVVSPPTTLTQTWQRYFLLFVVIAILPALA